MTRYRSTRDLAPKKKFLVIGDGKTERVYFDGLIGDRGSEYHVISVEHDLSGVRQIMTRVGKLMKEKRIDPGAGDIVALVTDADVLTPGDFDRLAALCSKADVDLHISNPCFEIWLLQYFGRYSKSRSSKELEEEMNAALAPGGYVKGRWYPVFGSKVEVAVKNADYLFGRECTVNGCRRNPCTSVHVLVKRLLSLRW